MDDAHLKEEGTASEQLFKGNFLHAKRDTVRLPDGKSATREYIVHPGAVVVVPLLDDGRVAMVRQYRYPIDRVMTEFPAGKLDPGEDPCSAASASCRRRPATRHASGPMPVPCTWQWPIRPRSSTSTSRAA